MQDKEELTSLVTVENMLNREGFTKDFRVTDKCQICSMDDDKKSYGPEEVRIVNFYRFEGETDPDDMSILYALECTDGSKGTISNSYGPTADAEIDAFILQVEDLGKNLDKGSE